jgi:DNA-binding MltR family transcriptional regulator
MLPSDLTAAIDSLKRESDRGAAVLAASLVENALGLFLERHCRQHVGSNAAKKLFDSNGPIATFSQRTLVATAFGLIEKADQEQLNLIREIRNHFAHHPLEASFNDAMVLEKTKQLRFHLASSNIPELQALGSSRMAYLLSCGYLLGKLNDIDDD